MNRDDLRFQALNLATRCGLNSPTEVAEAAKLIIVFLTEGPP